MKFYVAGGRYQEGDQVRFALVRPTGARLPYAWPESHPGGLDGECLHRLTKHHASLYEALPGCKELSLVHDGETRMDPRSVVLDDQQAKEVVEAVGQAGEDLRQAVASVKAGAYDCKLCGATNGKLAIDKGVVACKVCGNVAARGLGEFE